MDIKIFHPFLRVLMDPLKLQDFLMQHQKMVFGVCLRVLKNPVDAEDAVQETFTRLVEKASRISGHPVAWLHGCALLTALNFRRKEGIRRKFIRNWKRDLTRSGDEAHPKTELNEVVDECIEELPAGERAVLIVSFFEGLTLG